MRSFLVAAAVLLGACTAGGGLGHPPPPDLGPDLALVTCDYYAPDGSRWACIDRTADCIGPDGVRRHIWEIPIYCCGAELVAPAFDSDLGASPCQ